MGITSRRTEGAARHMNCRQQQLFYQIAARNTNVCSLIMAQRVVALLGLSIQRADNTLSADGTIGTRFDGRGGYAGCPGLLPCLF